MKRHKLDAKPKEYLFMGYCVCSKGYRLVDPNNPRKIIKSRNVKFIEVTNVIPCKNCNNKIDTDKLESNNILFLLDSNVICDTNLINNLECNSQCNNFNSNEVNNMHSVTIPGSDVEVTAGSESPSERPPSEEREQSTSCVESPHSSLESDPSDESDWRDAAEMESSSVSDHEVQEEPVQRPVRSTRGIPPQRYLDYDYSYLSAHDVIEPSSYDDAIGSLNSDRWQAAMDNEYQSLIRNKV